MVESIESSPTAPKSRIRSGVFSFVASVVLVVWTVGLVYLAAGAISGPDWMGVTATIAFFMSWVLVPILVLCILVFGIIALLLNRVPGKILGALAIVLPVALVVIVLVNLGVLQTLVG
jgi:hypothetical protein